MRYEENLRNVIDQIQDNMFVTFIVNDYNKCIKVQIQFF